MFSPNANGVGEIAALPNYSHAVGVAAKRFRTGRLK